MRKFLKNAPLKVLTCILTLFILTLFILTCGSDTANACGHDCNFYSREDAFLKSQAVFAGIAESNNETGTIFKVLEWYRTPDETFANADKVLVASIVGEGYIAGEEYIVHGTVNPATTAVLLVVENRNCWGIIRASTESHIARLEKWEKLPEEAREKQSLDDDLVFIGKVTQAKHSEKKCEVPHEHDESIKTDITSEVEFEVLRIFQNKSHRKALKNTDKISLRIFDCGRGYEAGKTYLVFAREAKHLIKKDVLQVYCFPPNTIYNLDEKDFLREMRKKLTSTGSE